MLITAITDRVAKLTGEDGTDCFIPEGCEQEEEEAHTTITKAMALDAHFRYYGRQFVIRVEAAARFPAPDPTGFTPVTSEMRYNMPILCPGQVKAEVDLLMLFESDWKESDDGERELADILKGVKDFAKENQATRDPYRCMNPGGEPRVTRKVLRFPHHCFRLRRGQDNREPAGFLPGHIHPGLQRPSPGPQSPA
jgi:hypothetical protein